MARRITAMRDEHSEQVLSIYQGGIDEGNATFETAAPHVTAYLVREPMILEARVDGR